ncbi:MAG: copper resistance protein CopC [Planctomycetota bacterium]|nr:copper resistance protein CopC [Planctomycetota bacterium]
MKYKIMAPVCSALLLLLVVRNSAGAHAFADHSKPKVGQQLETAPTVVAIWFDDDIKADQSVIEVFDKDGYQVDKKDSHGDSKDTTLLIVSLSKISTGTYKVVWKATCLQDHKTSGQFKFTVKR